MFGLLLKQLQHRRARTLTLGFGVLVAAVSFSLLTSAVSTSQLRIVRTVSRNFRPAYDILVRPSGSFTSIERREGLVQQNYLGGIFGGIRFDQYRDIRTIPGVEIAAPIANIGYIMPFSFVPLTINRFLTDEPSQLYRLRLEWQANGGLSEYPDSDQYVYFTKDRPFRKARDPGGVREVLSPGRSAPVCSGFIESHAEASGPFALASGSGMMCFSGATPDIQGGLIDYGPLPSGDVGAVSTSFFPILIAAIDPIQEQRLLDLSGAIVSGRMLRSADRPRFEHAGKDVFGNPVTYEAVPFIASTRTYVDEKLRVTVERLRTPRGSALYLMLSSPARAFRSITHLSGRKVGSFHIPIRAMYERLVGDMTGPQGSLDVGYDGYWTTGAVRYSIASSDHMKALPTRTPGAFTSGYYGGGWAPIQNRDVQFRKLVRHEGDLAHENVPAIRVIGRFDPERLPGFSPLSEVPLETYYPPGVVPADPASRRSLGSRSLLPTQNLGGYVSQPPLMMTTLRGLKAFLDPGAFDEPAITAPISVVRVRVEGVTGPDPESRGRIQQVAQLIHERTGLTVDITAGSSPHPVLVELPSGRFGQPHLLVREGWVEKGVAVRFLRALDRKSLALFLLILVVCTFFLANGAFASVRARRAEIGTLLCLGWSQRSIFRAVLAELSLIGLVAGFAGTGIAVGLTAVFSLNTSLPSTLLVVPIAVSIAVLAGVVPAWMAARAVPLDALAPAVVGRAAGRNASGVVAMALMNLRRLPSRTVLGALGLFVGVGALTLLLAINFAFRGVLVGTLLGGFVSVQVRGVDLASVVLAVLLGGLSVADVLFLNLRERAPELVTLRAAGWRESHLARLVTAEGLGMGLLGATPGAFAGAGIALLVGGIDPRVAWAGAAGVVVGVLVALVASVVPALLIGRMTPPTVLAED